MLVALVLAGTGVWLRIWLPLRAQLAEQARNQTELARRLDALDAWQATLNDDVAALEGRSRDLARRLDRLGPAQLAEWSLAEAAYLLRGAQRSAGVDYDPARAALALGLASASLAPVPHSDSVRRAIDSARAALEKVQGPDLNALGEELAQAATSCGPRPCGNRARRWSQPRRPAGAARVQQLWNQLGDIIVVQRVGTPVQPLLRPQEHAYLRQQLALKLTAADFALHRRDSLALQAELADLRSWADAYLDTSQPATAEALASLTRLAGIDLRPPLPDLSGLDEQLEALRRAVSADRMP